MSEMVKIRIHVQTNKVGSKCEAHLEIPAEEWDAMSEDERTECCSDAMWNMAEWGFNEESRG
ncbi:hypothetical protein FHW84_001779 [Dyella sp. SG562]|uniref:DUF7167 family protein n=1 Tax=Dyella sp. SG562 TaxID=2587017 RepID=UPI0014203032|nr:hypothetical protein [Dyella sp. SG562]NII73210.1 hypothetical protein [Dyella sp. SG562]